MAVTFTTRIGPGFTTVPTFEAMQFPAGEAHIKVVNDENLGLRTEVARVYGHDAQDLMLIGMWADAVHQRGDHSVLHMPYLPGARADRGIPFGGKVYADTINSFRIDQVIAFDVHSPVMEHLIDNLTVIESAALIREHIVGRADSDEHAQRYNGIIAPDAGAQQRAFRIANACHLPLYQASKHRDESTGKLSGFSCEPLPAGGKYLVVDDICDGGGTFIGLAQATGLPPEQLGLYVSHGVFSGAAGRLADHFGDIWTTDSFGIDPKPDGLFDNPNVFHTIPLNRTLLGATK